MIGYIGDMSTDTKFDIVGSVIVSVDGLKEGSDRVVLNFADGGELVFYHEQDCCESVSLSDYELFGEITGKVISFDCISEEAGEEAGESGTWTFYHLRTQNGVVTMRWLGASNGYYSERVDMDYFDPNGIRKNVTYDWQ